MRDFRQFAVFHKAHELALSVYDVSRGFPREELYGLTSQIRRAVASIPTNIAEGCGRDGDAELARFLSIAMGSASELEYHLLLARDLKVVGEDNYQRLNGDVVEVKRMLAALIRRLRPVQPRRVSESDSREVGGPAG